MSDFEDDFIPDEEPHAAEEADDFVPDDDAGSGRAPRVMQLPETRIEGAVDRNVAPRRSMFQRIGDVLLPPQAGNPQGLRGRIEEVFLPTPATPLVGRDRRGDAGGAALASNMALGFDDELVGAARAATGGGSYEQERDAQRSRSRTAQEQNPGLAIAGEVPAFAASALIPAAGGATRLARAARTLGSGAALSGAMSAGASEEDTASGVAADTAGGAAVGAGVGALGSALVGAPGALRRYLRTRPGGVEGLSRAADEARVLTSMGATGGTIARPQVLREATRVPGGVPEVARVMRENGMGGFSSAENLAEAATRNAERSRDAIGTIIEGVDDANVRIDAREFGRRLREAADELRSRPEMDDVAEGLRRRAATYEERFPEGMTMRQAQTLVADLGNIPNWVNAATGQRMPAGQQGAIASTRALRGQMDEAAEEAFSRTGAEVPEELAESGVYRTAIGRNTNAGRSALEGYRGARRLNQVSRIVGDAAEESTQRGRKNRLWGLMDAQTMEAGGGGLGGAALALGRRAVVGRGAAARATALETLVSIARSNPGRLGRYAPILQNASQRGGAELAATHYALQRDPEYRQLSAEIAAENEESR
jgi:hypothetical protein